MIRFSQKKFLSLKEAQAHKKCAELLEVVLTSCNPELLTYYNELASWRNFSPVSFSEPKALLDRLFFHCTKAGISRPEHKLQVTHEDKHDAASFLPIAIYLEALRSCHNIGSIIRTTEALRLGAVYHSETMPPLDHTKIQKSAMGCEEWVTYQPVASADRLPRPLIVLETVPTSLPYYDYTFPTSFTLAVGNEEYGCSDALLEQADTILHIPLYGRKNSLNVASAFAIVAAEIRKQKR